MIYIDNSATTRVLPAAAEAVMRSMEDTFYNPSSAYGPAVAAERLVEKARTRMGQALGASGAQVVYTSGGTESNNSAIFGALRSMRGKGRVITTKVEHPSVYEVFQLLETMGYETVYLDVDENGCTRLDALCEALTPDTQLVSMMHVNNETGAVNDIAQAGAIIKRNAP